MSLKKIVSGRKIIFKKKKKKKKKKNGTGR